MITAAADRVRKQLPFYRNACLYALFAGQLHDTDHTSGSDECLNLLVTFFQHLIIYMKGAQR